MKERELGTMQIANERIRIIEKPLDVDDPIQQEYIRLFEAETSTQGVTYDRESIIADWWAYSNDKQIVACANIQNQGEVDTVTFWVYVAKLYRCLGIGKMMLSLVTDQAIRYRKKTILIEVKNDNAAALHMLDVEDFEIQPEQHPGFTLLRKELKWT